MLTLDRDVLRSKLEQIAQAGPSGLPSGLPSGQTHHVQVGICNANSLAQSNTVESNYCLLLPAYGFALLHYRDILC